MRDQCACGVVGITEEHSINFLGNFSEQSAGKAEIFVHICVMEFNFTIIFVQGPVVLRKGRGQDQGVVRTQGSDQPVDQVRGPFPHSTQSSGTPSRAEMAALGHGRGGQDRRESAPAPPRRLDGAGRHPQGVQADGQIQHRPLQSIDVATVGPLLHFAPSYLNM